MPNKELYSITHSSPEYDRVGDYLADKSSPANKYVNDPEGFLNILGEDGKTNRQRIENSYKTPDEKRFIGNSANNLLLKVGTMLYLEYNKINEISFVTQGIEVVSNDEPAFKAAKLAEIEADPGYFQINKPIHGKQIYGTSKEMYPDMTVWIWCRSLSNKSDEDTELNGQFFDLSPFIIRASTSVNKSGGNFQLILPALVCELDSENKWVLKKSTIDQYENKNGTSIQGQGYVAQYSIFHQETLQENKNMASDDYLVRNQFLFHNIIGSNDLVLIRFETLDMEKGQRLQDTANFYIDKKNIAGRLYDMIGLVDTNAQSVNPGNSDVTIHITGRDLSKLFIEDGTYFYALENSQGIAKFAGQSEQKNSLTSRIFGDGAMNFIGLYLFTSIELIFKFVIQQLSNIRVVPDNLFESYGDRVNKSFNDIGNDQKKPFDKDTKHTKQFKEEKARGIWQVIKLIVDKSVTGRRLADSSFSTANGSLMNFLQSAAVEPLVEMYMDTYSDFYYLILRKPPFDQKSLISLIEGRVNTEDGTPDTPPAIVDIDQEDVLQENLSFDDREVYSWYHFFPRNNLIGDSKDYSLSYLPAIYLEEYAQIYGSKPFQQPHPYLPYVPMSDGQTSVSVLEKQAIEDLKYVIESHQYLPFTRKGSFVLNGDRRLKIGNLIRYKSTGEIFHVDSVQQDFVINDSGIDRTTTINVSRGMVEQLIYGTYLKGDDNDTPRFVSYFNIINTELTYNEREIETEVVVGKRKVKSKGQALRDQPIEPVNSFNQVTELPAEEKIIKPINQGIAYLDKYKNQNKKNLFIRFINGINALGYRVTLLPMSTNRSYGEQAALNRENPNNANPGTSRHEFGSAIDITATNITTGVIHSKTTDKGAWVASGIPALATSLGLRWASGDGSFGNYIDRVHFEIDGLDSKRSDDSQDEYENVVEKKKVTGLDRDGIFQNFKVNKFVFNFFLKRLQLDPNYRNVMSRKVYSQGGELLKEVTISGRRKK